MDAAQDPPASPFNIQEHAGENYSSTNLEAVEIYTSSIVTVCLGRATEASNFQVHRQLLVRHSTLFRYLPRQSSTKVELCEVSKDIFIMFVDWLYKQKLAPINEWVNSYGAAFSTCLDDRLTGAYVFALRYDTSGFKRALFELAVPHFAKTAPTHSAIIQASQRLPESCQFLRLLVDSFCINGSMEDLHLVPDVDAGLDSGSASPIKFLLLVAKRYAEIAKNTVKDMSLRSADYMSDTIIDREHPAQEQKMIYFFSD